ncbi:MAG: hypothetical protein NVSMB65_21770 [Chloroflexota bacterium]
MITREERWRRAHERVAAERVRPIVLDDSTCLVASSHVPGRGYHVSVDREGHVVRCSCPAGAWELPCKHAEAVRLLVAGSVAHAVLLKAS